MMPNIIRKLLGLNGKTTAIVEERTIEADSIKNEMLGDINRIKRKVDRLNQSTNSKLKAISNDIDSITYKIAVATGGKNRGLR